MSSSAGTDDWGDWSTSARVALPSLSLREWKDSEVLGLQGSPCIYITIWNISKSALHTVADAPKLKRLPPKQRSPDTIFWHRPPQCSWCMYSKAGSICGLENLPEPI
jgi:hypothetical protein